jgi:phosphoglycolate phosphatase-like HAD superfamily hydrolase
VLNPAAKTGHVRYALFDFDGTLSVIRRGWEHIMRAMMIDAIGGGAGVPPEIEAEVSAFIEHSTGILTIKQMQWLEAKVRQCVQPGAPVLSASQYKRIYNERLLQPVRQRLAGMDGSPVARASLSIAGAAEFLAELSERGVQLYLASGTDQEYVEAEAAVLGLVGFFQGRIYGARGDSETDSKEQVIQRILAENQLNGPELLVVGDGPVEIRCARQAGAVALGLAADEDTRQTLSARKRERLLAAGADLIIHNFIHSQELCALVCADR